MHPFNHVLKVKISPKGPFSPQEGGAEQGVVVEVPTSLSYLGFHSFAFENSIANKEILEEVLSFYKALKGKLVFWESLQDRGRRFKEDGEEYAFINMTDIIAYSDDLDIEVETVEQSGTRGSFNL